MDRPQGRFLLRDFVVLGLLVTLAFFSLLAQEATAETSYVYDWSPASGLSAPGVEASEATVISTPGGTTVAVWLANLSPNRRIIQAAVRPAEAADFSPPETITNDAESFQQFWVSGFDINVNVGGTLTLAWRLAKCDSIGRCYREVQVSTMLPSETSLSTPTDIDSREGFDDTGNSSDVGVASAPDGSVTVVWTTDERSSGDFGGFVLRSSTRLAGEADFEPGSVISDPAPLGEGSRYPNIAIGPDGAAVVSWTQFEENGSSAVNLSTRLPGAVDFGPVLTLASSSLEATSVFGGPIDIGPDGETSVSWKRRLSPVEWDGSTADVIEVTSRNTSSSPFGEVHTLGDTTDPRPRSREINNYELAYGPDGALFVAWNTSPSPGFGCVRVEFLSFFLCEPAIFSSVRGDTGEEFSEPLRVNPRANVDTGYGLGMAVGNDGTILIVWQSPDLAVLGGRVIYAAARIRDANEFTEPVGLSEPCETGLFPKATIGPDGVATAIWFNQDWNGGDNCVLPEQRFSRAIGEPRSAVNAASGVVREVAVGPKAPTIISGPSGLVSSTSASFRFKGDSDATFECRIDTKPWVDCSSPKSYSRLSQGRHTFEVRQFGAQGVASDPAEKKWTVDSVRPSAPSLTQKPRKRSRSRQVVIRFRAPDAKGGFICSLNGAKAKTCRTPFTSTLKPSSGKYVFRVWARDAAGNTSKATVWSFRILAFR